MTAGSLLRVRQWQRPNCMGLLFIQLLLLYQCLGFKFSVVHNNDMHARYDPMSGSSAKCAKGDDEKGLCFGGFGRVATAVTKAKAEGSVIYLNAGDTFQGTPWYTLYKGELAADLMNILAPDAASLGNHEFDDNVEGILPFLNKVKFPVVCCNLNLKNEPRLKGLANLVNSIIIDRLKTKIGVIGYLTPETKKLVQPNKVEFFDEVESINDEARKLVKKGVNIIIALGHSGYVRDKEIARRCPEVDLVIGGHSHTFLYTGNPPAKDSVEGPYPTVVVRGNGKKVPVLQAYAYTKYLGRIDMEFDDKGNLNSFSGKPILLDSSYSAQGNVQSLLDSKRSALDQLESQVVGTTMVYLSGDRKYCRKEECNFGNFIADGMIYARVLEAKGGRYWTDAAVALMNGGGIRASVDTGTAGTVTASDVTSVLPFNNKLSFTKMKGKYILRALEHAAALRDTDRNGGFLQFSGLRATYDYNRRKGKLVTNVSVLCAECKVPFYQPLALDKRYGVIVPTFVMNGGDGHNMKDPESPQTAQLQMVDRDALTKYFQEHKVVYPVLENRLTIIPKKAHGNRLNSPIFISYLLIFYLYIFYFQ